MRIIDRYVIRQVLMPFCMGVVVFTFVFIIRALIDYVEPLVARGVSALILVRVLSTLIPQALALSIPMSLLLGLLVAFGRLSGDREFVAMQACGVSLKRLLFPVGICSVLGWAVTSYVMLVAVPASNQTFREITFNVIAARAEGQVKPRVFFRDFPGLTVYVRDVPTSGSGWNGVFIADSRPNFPAGVYVSRSGRVSLDRVAQTVELVLEDVSRHTTSGDEYQVGRFGEVRLRIDPATVFPRGGLAKDYNEMTIAELRQRIGENAAQGVSTHNQYMAIHRKFAIPVACLVFGVIGLALGATHRRDGALGSFGLGLVVVFAYYVPLYLFPAMTKGGHLPPWLAVWLPNFLLGLVAVFLLLWRNRVADQPIRVPVPAAIRRVTGRLASRGSLRTVAVMRILDGYVAGSYLNILALTVAASLAVFYISTFIDLSDKLFKGNAPGLTLAEYFLYATPQFAYYILPISVLIATLVTIGMLTKNSELVVMKACGVSLYRVAIPMLVCATIVGGTLFLLDATVLGVANRRAEARKDLMKGVATRSQFHQPWVVGHEGSIYFLGAYDPLRRRVEHVDVYEFDAGLERMVRRTFATSAVYLGSDGEPSANSWRLQDGWTRSFDGAGRILDLEPFQSSIKELEAAAYFSQEPPDARYMSYSELHGHTERLRSGGFDVLQQQVDLARKVAFPFVTLIMTLIAIPFAVTMGRSGTMAGIAVGIALALLYWGTISVSAALGAGGAMPPVIAAWAPNLLFGAGAAYLVLTVRT